MLSSAAGVYENVKQLAESKCVALLQGLRDAAQFGRWATSAFPRTPILSHECLVTNYQLTKHSAPFQDHASSAALKIASLDTR